MGRHRTDDDYGVATWLLVWASAIRRGRAAEAREARAELSRLGIGVTADADSPLRQSASPTPAVSNASGGQP